MDTRTANRLDMMRSVRLAAVSNSTIIESIPALNSAGNRFGSALSAADDTIVALLTEAKSITIARRCSKEDLVSKADTVASGLKALAHSMGNEPLMIAVRFWPTAMIRRRYDILNGKCKNILAVAGEYSAQLAGFGVDATAISALENAIKTYEEKNFEPRKAGDLRKANNLKLKTTVRDAINILKNEMDPLVHILPSQYADFRELFRNARRIYDRHGKRRNHITENGSGMIKGTVTSASDGSPVKGAFVKIAGPDLITETTDDGKFMFENIPAGIHTLRILAAGFPEVVKCGVEVPVGVQLVMDFKLAAEPPEDE
jgi:hypothetical protein